jgi:CBS domain-containing protein
MKIADTTEALHASHRLARAPSSEVCVGEVMHEGVFFCPPEAPLRYAAEMMARHHVHSIVVLGDDEEGGLWGVVSDGDVLDAISRGELDQHKAGAATRTPLVTISRSDSVVHAAQAMRRHAVTHLLVVAGGRPVGVVSTLDLAAAVAAGMVDS